MCGVGRREAVSSHWEPNTTLKKPGVLSELKNCHSLNLLSVHEICLCQAI